VLVAVAVCAVGCTRGEREEPHVPDAATLRTTQTGDVVGFDARTMRFDVVRVPAGLQPRAALGHLTFTTLAALERLGVAPLDKEAENVAAHLDALRSMVEPSRPEAQNPAKQLARALHGKLPLIYGAGPLAVAAARFATQLHENPKVLAHAAAVPECHHNELSAWFGDAAQMKNSLPVVLTGAGPGPLAAREQVTTFLSSHDAQEIRTLCSEISVIARGRLVYTGPSRDLGADLDTFEERLVQLLVSGPTPTFQSTGS